MTTEGATDIDQSLIDAIVAAGRRVIEKDLTWGTSGNISARVSDTEFLVSASGKTLDSLGRDSLVRCWLDGSFDAAPGARPSVETGMHRELYRVRPDAGAVLHASPFYTTLVASSSIDIDPNLMSDTAYYVREVRRAPFKSPGSEELARAAAERAGECNVLLLDNHGALTIGKTPAEAVTRMEALELLCRMLVYGAIGVPLKPLAQEDVDAMLRKLSGHTTA